MSRFRSLAITLGTVGLLYATAGRGEDSGPELSASRAAVLAEQAIAKAGLPATCYIRSMVLREPENGVRYYALRYLPLGKPLADAGPGEASELMDIIHVAMDGSVTFQKERVARPVAHRRIIIPSPEVPPAAPPNAAPSPSPAGD